MANKDMHEIAKLELNFKFLYFLRDIGLQSAQWPAINAWNAYVQAQVLVMMEEINTDGVL